MYICIYIGIYIYKYIYIYIYICIYIESFSEHYFSPSLLCTGQFIVPTHISGREENYIQKQLFFSFSQFLPIDIFVTESCERNFLKEPLTAEYRIKFCHFFSGDISKFKFFASSRPIAVVLVHSLTNFIAIFVKVKNVNVGVIVLTSKDRRGLMIGLI